MGVIVFAFAHALLNILFSIFPLIKLLIQVNNATGKEIRNIMVK